MASGFLVALAKKKPPADDANMADGGDDTGGDDSGDAPDDLKDEPKDEYSKVTDSALADIAEILGVQEKDRDRFDSALEDLCEACAKRAVSEEG
jgi:hypothetical protein